MTAKAPFAWYGGKQYLVPTLLDLLPPHEVFVEVYGGAASLLFNKRPSLMDVYNDIDVGLVNFFRVLRDRRRGEELQKALRLTPYAREEWRECIHGWQEAPTDVEMARQWFMAVCSSFGHHLEQSGWSYSLSSNARGNVKAQSFRNNVANLESFIERMQTVQVECLDALEILRRYDAPNVLFYLDPPYVLSTRGKRRAYREEMTDSDHEALLVMLPNLVGKIIISGYRHPMYDEALASWWRVDRQMAHATALVRNRGRRYVTECIWLSPNATQHQPQLPFEESMVSA